MRALKATGQARGESGDSDVPVPGSDPRKAVTVPDRKMQNDRSQPRGAVRPEGFTLLELLIVMSIILVLSSMLLPCLMRAKRSALELCAMHVGINEEGKVLLEIQNRYHRKVHEDIYMIKIDPPRNCRVRLKSPYPPGMKLIRRDGQDYIKWRPRLRDIGTHAITVVFEGEEVTEQEIKVYVFNEELLEAQREAESDAD